MSHALPLALPRGGRADVIFSGEESEPGGGFLGILHLAVHPDGMPVWVSLSAEAGEEMPQSLLSETFSQ